MIYREIESKFDSVEGLNEILEYCQTKIFDKLDYYSNLFRNGGLGDPTVTITALDDLTGIYMELRTFYDIAITEKINRELSSYFSKKTELEKNGEKIVVAALDKEASLNVAIYRRVENILEGKLEICKNAISTCQSKLKYYTSEMSIHKCVESIS